MTVTYTYDANPQLEKTIQQHQAFISQHIVEHLPSNSLAAIILIGGYGRAEGGYVFDDNCLHPHFKPYNDYDYFLVFHTGSPTQIKKLTFALPDISAVVGIDVDCYPILKADITKLEYSLMNAEMRLGHRVVWGDAKILTGMPTMDIWSVPTEEFTRLLTNRGCLLLMNLLNNQHPDFSRHINKAWLAIGDTTLRLHGTYALSYLQKKQAIDLTNSNRQIKENYKRAIDIRLRPDLHRAWHTNDLDPVCNQLMRLISVTKNLSNTQSNTQPSTRPKTISNLIGNLIRNLSDRRLYKIDRLMLEHPRARISAGVSRLLRDTGQKHWRQEATILLKLWRSYS